MFDYPKKYWWLVFIVIPLVASILPTFCSAPDDSTSDVLSSFEHNLAIKDKALRDTQSKIDELRKKELLDKDKALKKKEDELKKLQARLDSQQDELEEYEDELEDYKKDIDDRKNRIQKEAREQPKTTPKHSSPTKAKKKEVTIRLSTTLNDYQLSEQVDVSLALKNYKLNVNQYNNRASKRITLPKEDTYHYILFLKTVGRNGVTYSGLGSGEIYAENGAKFAVYANYSRNPIRCWLQEE